MESKNVLVELLLSCYSVKSYSAIVKNGFLKRLLYHILLTSVLFVIIICIPYAGFVSKTGGIQSVIEEYVPEFIATGDTLTVSEPIINESENTIIMVDTSKYFEYDGNAVYCYDDYESYSNMIYSSTYSTDSYSQMCFIDNNKIMLYEKGEGTRELSVGEITEMTGDFNRQSLIDLCNGLVPALGVIVAIGMFFGVLWNTLVSAIILAIIAGMQHREYNFMQCYTISLYARTPFSLIFAGLSAFGMTIPFKSIIALVGTAVYSAVIIKSIDENADIVTY